MISFTRNKKVVECVSDNGASEIAKPTIEWSVEKELLLVEWADINSFINRNLKSLRNTIAINVQNIVKK